MTLEKKLTKKIDERDSYYIGLSARMAWVGTVITALLMNWYFILRRDFNSASLVMVPISIGIIIFVILSIKWKVGNKK